LRHTVHLDAREGEFASPDPEDSGGERDAEHAWLVLQSERRAVELGDGVNFQDWLGTRPGRRKVELRLLCLRLYLLLGVCDPGPRLLVVGRQLDPATDGPHDERSHGWRANVSLVDPVWSIPCETAAAPTVGPPPTPRRRVLRWWTEGRLAVVVVFWRRR
jgi:hypothetical protein